MNKSKVAVGIYLLVLVFLGSILAYVVLKNKQRCDQAKQVVIDLEKVELHALYRASSAFGWAVEAMKTKKALGEAAKICNNASLDMNGIRKDYIKDNPKACEVDARVLFFGNAHTPEIGDYLWARLYCDRSKVQ